MRTVRRSPPTRRSTRRACRGPTTPASTFGGSAMNRRTLLSALALMPCVPYARGLAHETAAHVADHGKRRAGLAMSAAVAPHGARWIGGLNGRRQPFVQAGRDGGGSWSGP